MSIDAGSIRYSIETDTSSQLKAENVVKKSTGNIAKSFSTVDRAAAKTSKISKEATKNVGKFGRASGQAGIQFQQFIGQIQGGQNAMLALSQQSADLGFVLGAPLLGAIVGISASVAGILAPSLLAGKDNTELLEKAIEQLMATTAQASDGTIIFSESLEKLARKSKAAAAVEIALGMQRAKEVIKLARKEVDELASSWESFFSRNATGLDAAISQLKQLEKVAKASGETQVEVLDRLGGSYEASVTGIGSVGSAVNKLSKEYGLSTTESLVFVRALAEFKRDKSAETFQNLSTVVSALATNMDKPNVKFIEMAKNINDTALNAKDAADSIDLYEQATNNVTEALSDNNSETIKNAESLKSLVNLIRDQAATLGFTDRQLAIHAAALRGAGVAEIEQINISFDAIEAHDKRTEALKKEQAAIDAKSRSDKRAADATSRQIDRDKKREKRQALSLAGTTIARGMSPIERLELEHEELNKLKAKFTEDDALFQDALTANEAQQAEIRQAIALKERKGRQQAQQATQDFILGSVTAITSGIMASVDEQSAAFKAAFLIEKAVAIASILVNTELAAAKVLAHDAGILGLGAVVTSNIVRGIGFASAAFVGAQAVAGAREHGGPVSAGKSFLVGERGPEIFTPGAGGNVTSNKESFGGTTLNVLVENNTPSQVSTQMSDDGKQLKIVINEIASQIRTNQGAIPKALRSSTNTTFKASR